MSLVDQIMYLHLNDNYVYYDIHGMPISFNQNTTPQLSADVLKRIHSIELKKPTMIYTTAHKDKLLTNFKDLLLQHCGIYAYDNLSRIPVNNKQYYLYLTSGNNESNKNIIYATITSFKHITKRKPHIIVCDTDNPGLIKYLNQLKANSEIDLDIISINVQGCTISAIIEKKIIPKRTCLITVSYTNRVFSSINNIKKIGELAKKNSIPMHVNCNMIFGHTKINPHDNDISSFVMDFTHIGGIKNFGILGIKKELLNGYQLEKSVADFKPTVDYSEIEPILLELANNTIAAIYKNRKIKETKIKRTYNLIIKGLKKQYNLISLVDYLKRDKTKLSEKKTIIILYTSTSICSALSFIPLDIEDVGKKHLVSNILFDKIDKIILQYYKFIFKDIFKKSESNIDILDNVFVMSWNDKVTHTQINSFLKILAQAY